MQKLDLPEPSEDEKKHSQKLVTLIRHEIEAAGGWLDFARYMELALYAPGLGYYSAGLQKFGAHGDFITAPEVSPLFAQTLANPVAEVLSNMPAGDVIEFGAGSGVMAADLLAALKNQQSLPARYLIIELSAELRHRQKQTIAARVPELLSRVHWLSELPEQPVKAVVLANEVLDAMPVQRFVKQDGDIQALGVAWAKDGFTFKTQTADEKLQQAVVAIEQETGRPFSAAYSSELNLNITPWLQSIADVLSQGAVYLIDYGYPRAEYYSPERQMGTFMCYYRHRALDEPFWYPGLLDMTAFVDFTAVAEAALQTGFEVEGFTSQGNFLLDSGLAQLVEKQQTENIQQQLQIAQQMKTLTLPTEMGERFKVMGLSKNLAEIIPGFKLRDYRNRL
ncbi:MAG: SAM-dependent methyltransferase [Gammaproteobacteria bacterium]|nr:SAM-dependent methyltransferase [Gammaproteobacteria bacterium]